MLGSKKDTDLFTAGIFKDKGYFDVQAEYCKATPADVLGRYTVTNHGPEKATVHVLPTLWYRNVWSWGPCDVSRTGIYWFMIGILIIK